jgi:HNH endonuclease
MNIFVGGEIVVIDQEDFRFVIQGLSISRQSDGRLRVLISKGVNRHKYLSRLIMGCPNNLLVDHRDGNPLNHVRTNLRIVTHAQNTYNRESNALSGYKGVTKIANGYRAEIEKDGRRHYLGFYLYPEQAAEAYKLAADKFFGEHALHNSRK